MTLPSSGLISLGAIRAELNLTGLIALGDAAVRTLLGKASGLISLSDAYSKSSVPLPVSPSISVTSVTPTSVTLSFSCTNATSYYVYCTTTATYIYIGTNTSYTYTGLNSNASYSFEVYGHNVTGNSGWSTIITGTTAVPVPTSPSISVSAITSSSISLSFSCLSATTFYVYCITTSTYVYIGPNSSYTYTGLNSSTTYTFEVYGSNSSGTSGWSATVSATTSVPAPINPTISVVSSTSNSITLSFGCTYATTLYVYCTTTYTYIYIGPSTSYTYTGLSNNTSYAFQMYGSNASGSSGWTALVYGSTTLPAPTNASIGISSLTYNFLSFYYSATYATGYVAYVNGSPVYGGSNTSYGMSASPNTTYYLQALCSNNGGSIWTNQIAVTTPASNAPTSCSISVTSVTASSFTLSITTDKPATSFTISVGGVGTFSSSSTTPTISGLLSGTSYGVQVYASASDGGVWSNSILVQTNTTNPSTPSNLYLGNNYAYDATHNGVVFVWNSAPAQDNVTSYSWSLNGGNHNGSSGNLSAATTTLNLILLSGGYSYTFTLWSVNSTGSCITPATLTFTL